MKKEKESYPINYEKARPFQSTQKNCAIIMKWCSLHKKELGIFSPKKCDIDCWNYLFLKKEEKR
jgi:hypothetical protein